MIKTPLAKKKRNFQHVGSTYPSSKVKIAIIGEFPGTDETYYGKPFCGADGRLLNSALRSANIDRDACYVGYFFDEQPDDEDISKLGWYKDEGRLEYNRARLAAELVACDPTVIVALGPAALWALTGHKTVIDVRGTALYATEIIPGCKIVPTFSPATIRKAYHWLPLLVTDLIKAKREVEYGRKISYPKVELLIEPTLDDVREFAEECFASPKLSVDIETGWGQITSIAFAPTTTRALSIPFVDLRRPSRCFWETSGDELEVWRTIKDICEAPNPKVGQNTIYDISWLWEQRNVALVNYRFDTRLRHKILYPELPATLGSMGASYTRFGAWKGWTSHHKKEIKQDG